MASKTKQPIALLCLTAILLLSACASMKPAATPEAHGHLRARIVHHAEQALGIPYRYGGETVRGFDCSGLTRHVYAAAGLSLPRTTEDQYRRASAIAFDALAPGDAVFFHLDGKPSHVGIYIGGGEMIHAPSSGGVVRRERIDKDYWRSRYVGALVPDPR